MSLVITAFPVFHNIYLESYMIPTIACCTMLTAVCLLFILPTLVSSSGEGNIHLLEDEVASALRACSYNESAVPRSKNGNNRQSRSADFEYPSQYGRHIPKMDDLAKQDNNMNLYDHERRNTSDITYIYNGSQSSTPKYGGISTDVKYVTTATTPDTMNRYSNSNLTRSRRSYSLLNKSDRDKCLNQCVFANLQVVDARGIPREAELWNKVQTAVTSHLSSMLLKDQIRACFQELDQEDEDNGCSYANSLERCLMLRFSDRKINLDNA